MTVHICGKRCEGFPLLKGRELTCVYTRGTHTVSYPISAPNLLLMSESSTSSVCTIWSLVISPSFLALLMIFVAQTSGIQYFDIGDLPSIFSKTFLSLSNIRPGRESTLISDVVGASLEQKVWGTHQSRPRVARLGISAWPGGIPFVAWSHMPGWRSGQCFAASAGRFHPAKTRNGVRLSVVSKVNTDMNWKKSQSTAKPYTLRKFCEMCTHFTKINFNNVLYFRTFAWAGQVFTL